MRSIRRPVSLCWLLLMSLGPLACGDSHPVEEEESDAWAVTAWGEQFEIFAEADPLRVGTTVKSHTHVTILEDFSPLRGGTVSIVLRSGGTELVFTEEAPIRDGIYSIPMTPESTGEFEILYRVDAPHGVEEIFGGRVQVTDPEGDGGDVIEAAAPSLRAATIAGGEAPISFLKEQQWRTEFATEWVAEAPFSDSIRAAARIRVVAGGEVLLTAPMDGVVGRQGWPYRGLDVDQGRNVFEIVPRIGVSKSLAELGAASSGLESELEVARQRRARLEELLEVGAASQAEVERARSREVVLEAQADAARRDLSTARSTRQGATRQGATRQGSGSEGPGSEGGVGGGESVSIRAPFSGRVAEVLVTPGQTVEAGDPMARLVRTEPVWIEVRLRPGEAGLLPDQPVGVVVSGPGFGEGGVGEVAFGVDEARLVSVSPGVDAKTGTVQALFEVDATVDQLRLGAVGEAEILLGEEHPGVVLPESGLVDDSGVMIVYAQLSGEEFARIEVDVIARRSGQVLIEGLPLGSRVVTVGGSAIRRATLVAADPGEGHIH